MLQKSHLQPPGMVYRTLFVIGETTPLKINMESIMDVWKIIFLSKWVICRFHVNLPGCTFPSTGEFAGFQPSTVSHEQPGSGEPKSFHPQSGHRLQGPKTLQAIQRGEVIVGQTKPGSEDPKISGCETPRMVGKILSTVGCFCFDNRKLLKRVPEWCHWNGKFWHIFRLIGCLAIWGRGPIIQRNKTYATWEHLLI